MVLWGTRAAKRNVFATLAPQLRIILPLVAITLGSRQPGRQRVDADALSSELIGQAFGQNRQCRLGGLVVGHQADRFERADRGNVDHTASDSPLQHMADDRLGKKKREAKVGVQHLVVIVDGCFEKPRARGDADVVDQHVQLTEQSEYPLGQVLRRTFVPRVDLKRLADYFQLSQLTQLSDRLLEPS